MDSLSPNQIIAKNATMLYFRMFITMAISFYTSRIVLQALGVSDYGIYNVVGGITVLINVLISSLGGATTRFLTFALGKNDIEYLKTTFSTATIAHIGLALVFIFIAETVGLWFVNSQLVIPDGRMMATNWVYQSSIIAVALGITQTPYSASITSHERMSAFAYIEIVNALCKLGIAALVLLYSGDHLILYSILYAVLSISFQLFYRYYCIKHFVECRISKCFDRKLFKEMMTFSGWTMTRSITLTFKNQGMNILINRFLGTLVNAAAGVALQVQGILYAFTGNVATAFRPQIIKSYAATDYKRTNELIVMGTRYTTLVTTLTTIPFIFNMDYLMSLWLKEVPVGSVVICQICLFANYFNSFNCFFNTTIEASGKIKCFTFFMSSIYVIYLIGSYVLLRHTHSYIYLYVFDLTCCPLATLICIFILKRILPFFSIRNILFNLYMPMFCIFISSLVIAAIISQWIKGTFLSFLTISLICTIYVLFISYCFVLNVKEKKQLISFLCKIR